MRYNIRRRSARFHIIRHEIRRARMFALFLFFALSLLHFVVWCATVCYFEMEKETKRPITVVIEHVGQ